MGNLNCCWVFLSLNGQMYIYMYLVLELPLSEEWVGKCLSKNYILWKIPFLSQTMSHKWGRGILPWTLAPGFVVRGCVFVFWGRYTAARRLIYMESEFKLNSGTKCEHFVSTANRGQNQSVERHCLGENKQLEIKIYRIGSCSRGWKKNWNQRIGNCCSSVDEGEKIENCQRQRLLMDLSNLIANE